MAFGSGALIALSFLSFWPNYISRPFRPIDAYTHFHAALGASWLTILLAQSLLIRRANRALHRLIGRLSLVVAPLFVTSAVLLAHYRFSRMSEATFNQEAFTLYLPLSAALLFACAYACAIAWRHDVSVHARCMACTALLPIDPVLGRFMAFYLPAFPAMWQYQLITFGVEALLIYVMLRSLPEPGRGRTAFRGLAAFFVFVLSLWFVVPYTEPWFAFAAWFRSLAIT